MRILPSVTRRSWLLAAGLLVAWAVTALAVVVPELASARHVAAHLILLLAVLGLTASGLVVLARAWRRMSVDRELVREIQESEARSSLLTAQVPANVWTTDTELRLKTVFGAQAQRLANSGAHGPGRTLYDIFGTRDPGHPAIEAHLRALGGETARYERSEGDIVLEGRVEPLRDDTGAVVGCVGVALDVTQRRVAEQHLRLLANAIESASDMISVTDAENRFVFVNEAFLRAYGYVRGEVLGRTPALLGPPDDVPRQILSATMQGGWTGDLVNHRKDGTEVPVSLSTTVIRDPEDRILGLLGVARDTSERRRAEEALRRSQERFELAALATDEVIWEWDSATRTTWWSRSCERVLGYAPGAARMDVEWWRDNIHPDDRERVMSGWRHAVEGTEKYWADEFRLRGSHGEYVVATSLGYIVRDAAGKALRMVGALADVTFRKQAEAVAGRYQALVESSEDAIISTDLNGVVESWNLAAERLYGYPAEEVLGRNVAVLEPPGLAGEGAALRERLVRGERPQPYETTRRRRDGSLVEISTTLSPIFDGAGQLVGVSAVVRGITERKRAEAALAESERRLRSIGDRMRLIGLGLDTSGRITYCNDYLAEVSGWSREELIGSDYFSRFIPPGDPVIELFKRALATGEVEAHHRNEILTRDGLRREIEWNNTLLRDSDGRLTGVVSIGEDATERARAERELRRSQEELRALARHLVSVREEEHAHIARVIHDDLGQALTAVRLDLSWVGRRLPAGSQALRSKVEEMVVLTDETIEAGRSLVTDLRPPILDDLGLVPALEWYLEHFGERAKVRAQLDVGAEPLAVDGPLAVTAYRIVQEALTNVARHAEAKHVTVRLGTQADALVLEIVDDGKGIRADAGRSERSFGIIGMRERAVARGGVLEVASAPGGGTIVRATIPLERRREPVEPG